MIRSHRFFYFDQKLGKSNERVSKSCAYKMGLQIPRCVDSEKRKKMIFGAIRKHLGQLLHELVSQKDDLQGKSHSFDIQHLASLLILKTVQHTQRRRSELNTTKPLFVRTLTPMLKFGVDFDCCLGFAKWCPLERKLTQINAMTGQCPSQVACLRLLPYTGHRFRFL